MILMAIGGILVQGVGMAEPRGATFRIKAGNSALPEGTTIEVSIGGSGCDCDVKSIRGKVDSRGYVTVILRSNCPTVDTATCKALAQAEVASGGGVTIYRGSSRLTETRSGPYVSTVIVVP